jgi:folate-binding protein YgfZ
LISNLRWFEDSDWSYLKVTGPDRVDFFHRLTTNRMPKPGEPLAHAFFLSVTAKVLAELWVGAEEESLSLFLPSAQLSSAKENVDRYHFGEKMQLVEPSGHLFVVVDASAEQIEALAPLAAYAAKPDPRYGASALWFFADDERFKATLESMGSHLEQQEAERLRVATGRPRFGLDYTEETLFLEMAQQGDFSETKGCYPGQEIVARVLHRGRLNRHLRGFESKEAVPPGWLLIQDGKEMARVTTSVSWPNGGTRGLLYVRKEVGEDGAELTGQDVDGQMLTLTVRPRALEVLTGEPA